MVGAILGRGARGALRYRSLSAFPRVI